MTSGVEALFVQHGCDCARVGFEPLLARKGGAQTPCNSARNQMGTDITARSGGDF